MECTGRTKKRRRGDGMHRPKEKEEVLENEDDESLLMEHHLRREELERDDFEQELWLRFNLNLRSKTEMSDGAELSLLEVRLCLTSIGFV
jgi:hypothetical protein